MSDLKKLDAEIASLDCSARSTFYATGFVRSRERLTRNTGRRL
jgi:hypothetical protein